MPKPKKPSSKRGSPEVHVLLHPGTQEMLGRIGNCNKPPLDWYQMADGSWIECQLRADCTYGNCHEVPASQVPPEVRKKKGG